MKNWIIALEISDLRSKAAIHADFDSKEEAANYMLDLSPGHELFAKNEIIVLKRQNRNQWWHWDRNVPSQGWIAFEIPEVQHARFAKRLNLNAAQTLIRLAVNREKIDPDAPTGCVESALQAADAAELRARAMLLIARGERTFLEVLLEAHGNIEYPEQE